MLGNPPYNSFAGISTSSEEQELTAAYREVKDAPKPAGQGLNDLYAKFFRMAERQIIERTSKGVVAFISNCTWLDGLSFTGMREKYLQVFDKVWIDNLNGDSRSTGKITPDGKPDPSVFSTSRNREGIQVGTAVAVLVRKKEHFPAQSIFYRDIWGAGKLQQLQQEAEGKATAQYEPLTPEVRLGFPFRPINVTGNYLEWPTLEDLFPSSFPGVKTSRDSVLVDVDRERLEERISFYLNPDNLAEEVSRRLPSVMASDKRFDGPSIRRTLLKKGMVAAQIVPYAYRPFDTRWLYWEPETKLLDEKRADFFRNTDSTNLVIEARQHQTQLEFDRGYVTQHLADNFGAGLSNFFPLYVREDMGQLGEAGGHKAFKTNLSVHANAYLLDIGGTG